MLKMDVASIEPAFSRSIKEALKAEHRLSDGPQCTYRGNINRFLGMHFFHFAKFFNYRRQQEFLHKLKFESQSICTPQKQFQISRKTPTEANKTILSSTVQ